MTMQTKEWRNTTYLNDNAQTPLNRFAVYMLYSQLCNKYSDKSNIWNLSLSLSEATSNPNPPEHPNFCIFRRLSYLRSELT